MKLLQISIIFTLTLISTQTLAKTASEQNGIFAQAIIDGSASTPVSILNKQFSPMIRELQSKTHDNGQILVQVKRLFKFKDQPKCGRVLFSLSQPSSNTTWPIGGQLNVCEDGLPPLGICKDKPTTLVSRLERCSDNSEPQDTPEVAQAIKDALANGDSTHEQIAQKLKAASSKKGEIK